mgnify:CR=1 FL=1
MTSPNRFQQVFEVLDACYGPQHWWPAETAFEVMVGAVLVQNTAWHNASRAIRQLRDNGLLSAPAIRRTDIEQIASVITSSGYYNVKARRLKSLCDWLHRQGEIDDLRQRPLAELRKALLAVHGIGRETADDILLYALDKPVFVIDSYTRRLFSRLGLLREDAHYEELRAGFESALPIDARLFNQYHALIVHHARHSCQ